MDVHHNLKLKEDNRAKKQVSENKKGCIQTISL